MPNKEDILSNWAEPKCSYRDLKRSIIESSDTMLEMVLNVWADCFMDHELELVQILLGRGLDGFVLDQQNNVKHLICYNPDILKLCQPKRYKSKSSEIRVPEPFIIICFKIIPRLLPLPFLHRVQPQL